MSPRLEITAELQRAFDAAAQLNSAEQRWVASDLLREVQRLVDFETTGRTVLEEIVQTLLQEPQNAERFALFRQKLRRELPVAVSRQFSDSYRRLDSEIKETVRQKLLTWTQRPSSEELLVTPFKNVPGLSWVHLQTDMLAVLSIQDNKPLWFALFRVVRKRISLTSGPKTQRESLKLRQYLEER